MGKSETKEPLLFDLLGKVSVASSLEQTLRFVPS